MQFIAKDFNELTTRELYEILKSRAEVFMLGQGIICQDMDDVDYKSHHIFLWENGRAAAYMRAFYKSEDDVRIGRVLALNKRQGVGSQLMKNALEHNFLKEASFNLYAVCSEIDEVFEELRIR